MHLPRISRELLMFPASFSRSPKVLALLQRSEPARSHRENLRGIQICSLGCNTPVGHLVSVSQHLLTLRATKLRCRRLSVILW